MSGLPTIDSQINNGGSATTLNWTNGNILVAGLDGYAQSAQTGNVVFIRAKLTNNTGANIAAATNLAGLFVNVGSARKITVIDSGNTQRVLTIASDGTISYPQSTFAANAVYTIETYWTL